MQGFLAEKPPLVDTAERGVPAMGTDWEGPNFSVCNADATHKHKPVKILCTPSTANYKAVDAVVYMA